MADRLKLLALALFLLAPSVPERAWAQTLLSDPTRPPMGIIAPTPDAGEVTGPVLQSVVIPKKGRPVAVIGGKQVKLWEMYGESRLIRLTEREAVLQGPAGIERLMLTPGVEKTNIISKSPAARRAQSGGMP